MNVPRVTISKSETKLKKFVSKRLVVPACKHEPKSGPVKIFLYKLWWEVYFGKEINVNVLTSIFLITLVGRLHKLYHLRTHKCIPRLKKKVPYKIHSQEGTCIAHGHCKEVSMSPHFMPTAKRREESRKDTLIEKEWENWELETSQR